MSELSATEVAICEAMESYADQIEMLELSTALEADGADSGNSGVLSRIRAALSKLRKKDKSGVAETDSAMNDFVAEANDAAKSGDKKKMIKLIAIAVAIIGLIITVILLVKKYASTDLDKQAAEILKDAKKQSELSKKVEDASGIKAICLKVAKSVHGLWGKLKQCLMSSGDYFKAANTRKAILNGNSEYTRKDLNPMKSSVQNIRMIRDNKVRNLSAASADESFDAYDLLSETETTALEALESYVQDAEMLEFTSAFESDGADGEKSGILAKFRAALAKFRKGDGNAVAEMDAAVKGALNEADAAAKSKDPKRIRKAITIIIAVLASITGIVMVARALDKKFNDGKLSKGFSDVISNVTSKLPKFKKENKDGDDAAATGLLGNVKKFLSEVWGKVHGLLTKLPFGKKTADAPTEDASIDPVEAAGESAGLSGILALLCDSEPATESYDDSEYESGDDEEAEAVLEANVSLMMAEDNIDQD